MKRLRQQADPRPGRAARHPDAAGAGGGAARAGLPATQATVSRDVAEMGLVKVSRDAASGLRAARRARPAGDQRRGAAGEILRDLPIEIRPAGLMLVVRAVPGTAHAIAAALDRARWPEVAGTIAGDDTVFVACADRAALDRLLKRLQRLAAPSPRAPAASSGHWLRGRTAALADGAHRYPGTGRLRTVRGNAVGCG